MAARADAQSAAGNAATSVNPVAVPVVPAAVCASLDSALPRMLSLPAGSPYSDAGMPVPLDSSEQTLPTLERVVHSGLDVRSAESDAKAFPAPLAPVLPQAAAFAAQDPSARGSRTAAALEGFAQAMAAPDSSDPQASGLSRSFFDQAGGPYFDSVFPVGTRGFIESHLSLPVQEPLMRRYLEAVAELKTAPLHSRLSFSDADLLSLQKELAKAMGLALEEVSGGLLFISASGRHWLNRFAAQLEKNFGVVAAWSPLENFYSRYTAFFSRRGVIFLDYFSPVLTKPSLELFHEFLHAYLERGAHVGELEPLRSYFLRDPWGGGFPGENPSRSSYSRMNAFSATELFTNLNSLYEFAKTILAEHDRKGDWTSSGLESAPGDVRYLADFAQNPLFIFDAVIEMSAVLDISLRQAFAQGARVSPMSKRIGDFSGRILSAQEYDEYAKQDKGFYEKDLGTGDLALRVSLPTLAAADAMKNDGESFPVFFGNNRYHVAQEYSLSRIRESKMDLSDPKVQEKLALDAAVNIDRRLSALVGLYDVLGPSIERLRALLSGAQGRADREFVVGVRDCARKAFLDVFRSFVRRGPDRGTQSARAHRLR